VQPAEKETYMKSFSTARLAAISSFGFTITLVTNILSPSIFGHKVLELASPNTHNTLLGYTTFAGALLSMFTLPLIGVLSDRTKTKYGQRLPFFLAGSLLLGANLFLIIYARSAGMFFFGVVLYYITNDIIFGPWMALYPDLVPHTQRGEAAGVRALLDILALIIGRQLAGQLIGQMDTLGQTALVIIISVPIVFMAFSLIVTWRATRDIGFPHHPKNQPPIAQALKNMYRVDLKTYPAFRWWFINRFFYWSAFNIMGTFLLFFIIDVLYLSEPEAQKYLANLAMVIGISILFIAIPAGKIADRVGRKPIVIWSGIIAVLGTAYILIVRDLNLLMFGGLLIGASAGIYISSNFALITDIVPQDEAARYMGVAGIASAAGSACARLMGAWIIDPVNRLTGSSVSGYMALYALAGVLYLFSVLAARELPAPQPQRSSEII